MSAMCSRALLLLVCGLLAAHAGVIPIVGVLIAALSPEIFLLGLIGVSICIASSITSHKIARGVLALAFTVLLGLNSRLPALLVEVWMGPAEHTQVISQLSGAVGQPIHVITERPVLSARQDTFAHARPGCRGDDCLATSGFRTPYTWVERDYWQEKVTDVVLTTGLSLAQQGEAAPTLNVRQSANGDWTLIHMTLLDAKGGVLARHEGRYRNGWPHETADALNEDHIGQPLAIEYLLHGNWLNRLVKSVVPHATPYPLAAFLRASTSLGHPQGTALGLGSRSEFSDPPTSKKVVLEVLEQKTHDPVWIIKEDRDTSVSKWSMLAWDKTREERCSTLLKPEVNGAPLMQTWHLFVNDATGRKKVRYADNAICEPDAIWFKEYAVEKGRMVLTKYTTAGDFQYRISFEKPTEPRGFAGAMMTPTFQVKDGYLYFEWWNSDQSGSDRHVARSMKVRIKEPAVARGRT